MNNYTREKSENIQEKKIDKKSINIKRWWANQNKNEKNNRK